MQAFYPALLAVASFWLGACPFSLWIGRWLLGKDIRDYGDGNPGAGNVFRAGGYKSGLLAVVLDVTKGVPFVIIAYTFFGLTGLTLMVVALGPILGHAFSPLLRFRGGKSVAVTFGALMALPQHEMLLTFTTFLLLGFLFINNDAWTAILGPAGSLAYLTSIGRDSFEILFMLCVLVIFVMKQFGELKTVPTLKGRLIRWLQAGKRET